MNRPQFNIVAGIAGAILFVAVFMIEGAVRPGYDPFGMYVSELSVGPRGWVQIANFMVFGLLFLVFARGLATRFRADGIKSAGPMLLRIVAISYFFSGPFVTDPGFVLVGQKSWHGVIHGVFGATVFLLMPISCFVFVRAFGRTAEWRSLRAWTLAAGLVVAGAVLLLTFATKLPVPQDSLAPWLGLIQRAAIIPFMAWLVLFGIATLRKEIPE